MTEIRKSKQRLVMEVLVIEYWNLRPARSCLVWQAGLFVIWCLEFVILDTTLQDRAITSGPRFSGQARPIEDPAMRGRTRFFKVK